MNEHEANEERVAKLGKTLDNAMLDAINALPPDQRPDMCQRVRDAMTNAPLYKIVDDHAERIA